MLAHAADLPSVRTLVLAAAAVLAAAVPALALAAEAQSTHRLIAPICRTHAEIEAKLLSDFGERKFGHGISGDGSLVELFVAPGGTFSVVKTLPHGESCIVDFGEYWQMLAPLEAARSPEGHPNQAMPF